jgi:predicted RNA-binding Zn-ribbon protein involved in translation (DUF1610 family)
MGLASSTSTLSFPTNTSRPLFSGLATGISRFLLWILALPIQILAFVISWVRASKYNPEKITCPACGFRGDSGTNGKSCTVTFVRVVEKEKAALRHTCFRCGCNEIYSSLTYPANNWLPATTQDQQEKLKQAAAKGVI